MYPFVYFLFVSLRSIITNNNKGGEVFKFKNEFLFKKIDTPLATSRAIYFSVRESNRDPIFHYYITLYILEQDLILLGMSNNIELRRQHPSVVQAASALEAVAAAANALARGSELPSLLQFQGTFILLFQNQSVTFN